MFLEDNKHMGSDLGHKEWDPNKLQEAGLFTVHNAPRFENARDQAAAGVRVGVGEETEQKAKGLW